MNLENRFARQLSCPFDPQTLGCQVPDPFSFPTQTYHLHQTNLITCGTASAGSVVFLPNPFLSMLDLGGTVSGTPCVSQTSFSAFGASSGKQYVYASTAATSLNNLLSTFRVVSWGLKISNLQPELSATGRIIVSYFPIGDTVPYYWGFIKCCFFKR